MTLFPSSLSQAVDSNSKVDSAMWLDRGVVAAVLLASAVALSLNVADPDLWGHVQYGRDALAHGLPVTTTYSYVAHNQRWINHEILAEYALAIGADWRSMKAVRERLKGPLSPDAALLTPFVALLELHARGSARYQDLKELLVGLTRSLTAALDAKDSYTYGHSERVARIARKTSRVQAEAANPKGVSLASSSPSSSPSKGRTTRTGPKTSSWTISLPCAASTTRVGS
jgi:hypothetical protein